MEWGGVSSPLWMELKNVQHIGVVIEKVVPGTTHEDCNI